MEPFLTEVIVVSAHNIRCLFRQQYRITFWHVTNGIVSNNLLIIYSYIQQQYRWSILVWRSEIFRTKYRYFTKMKMTAFYTPFAKEILWSTWWTNKISSRVQFTHLNFPLQLDSPITNSPFIWTSGYITKSQSYNDISVTYLRKSREPWKMAETKFIRRFMIRERVSKGNYHRLW